MLVAKKGFKVNIMTAAWKEYHQYLPRASTISPSKISGISIEHSQNHSFECGAQILSPLSISIICKEPTSPISPITAKFCSKRPSRKVCRSVSQSVHWSISLSVGHAFDKNKLNQYTVDKGPSDICC